MSDTHATQALPVTLSSQDCAEEILFRRFKRKRIWQQTEDWSLQATVCVSKQCCSSTGHTSHPFNACMLLSEIIFYDCSKRVGQELGELKISDFGFTSRLSTAEYLLDLNKMSFFYGTYGAFLLLDILAKSWLQMKEKIKQHHSAASCFSTIMMHWPSAPSSKWYDDMKWDFKSQNQSKITSSS